MKILVSASGSYDADPDGSLEVAASFPWPEGSEIHVVSVAEVIQPIMVGMVPDAIDAGEVQVRTDAEATIAATQGAQRFRSYGFHAEGLCLTGDPETEILDYAHRWGADLIVVGSHDRSAIDKFLTGSVSESIVKHAPCSVLVLKYNAER